MPDPIEIKQKPEMFGAEAPQKASRSKLYMGVLVPVLILGLSSTLYFGLRSNSGDSQLQASFPTPDNSLQEATSQELMEESSASLEIIYEFIESYKTEFGVYPAAQNINQLIDAHNFIGGFPKSTYPIIYGVYDIEGRQSDFSLGIVVENAEGGSDNYKSSFDIENMDIHDTTQANIVRLEEPTAKQERPKPHSRKPAS